MRRLLCWFGWHDWYRPCPGILESCDCCGIYRLSEEGRDRKGRKTRYIR